METMSTKQGRVNNDQLVDMKFITADSGMGDKWFYRLMSEGRFPRPIKLGRLSRWLAKDYYAWKDAQISNSAEEFEKRQREAFKRAEAKRSKHQKHVVGVA
ncbi:MULTISPECIES: helix-turn-helix transcriptional regulator [Enterobacteriaceae]|uniref:Response regulator inhibitor for tor operon n=2 Tax=Leclercia adecarboxylata TaxID=83655 RepID=A0A4U9HLT5_9ENTR|nr:MULTISPECIES: AlpA family phage regulatory protein [Enterobacteriaceae]KFC91481.1 phage regulatory protein [Leclercia adecarboxylata ATCC 23216 = NBRC 102595]UBH65998.1 AlpA family phage regulatory protein [Leclercia adecarboxylata]UQQ51963.1 AlpA family phage regulatory protein [Enterobacter roggenkampii]SPX66239.1 Response regulator inhibitor for tor operon [Leclercia adecarboxylata]STX25730.1 Response regulator inhibitor for tor operon [Leclercia adecarboxylata]